MAQDWCLAYGILDWKKAEGWKCFPIILCSIIYSFVRSYTFIELYKLVAKRVPGKSTTSFVMKEEMVVLVSPKATSKSKATSSSSKRRKKNDDDDDAEADTG